MSDGAERRQLPSIAPPTRRHSYGPNSPTVGDRGARRRRHIADAALACFSELGFHGTSVDDIARRADTSRATLYQYFAGKEDIFIELMTESGSALVRLNRRLGPLGPTATGFDNLHWWLGEWSWVFERYAPMFIEWTNVNTPGGELRPKLAEFVNAHTERFVRALEADGPYRDGDTVALSVLVLAMVSRTHYTDHLYRTGLSHREMIDSLAVAVQLLLFPTTPLDVLTAGPSSLDEHPGAAGDRRALHPRSPLPSGTAEVTPPPQPGLTTQAATTVRRLLDAAGQVFADNGYSAANVELIVTAAGLARGTFYRYFSTKHDLLVALAHECATAMVIPFRQLADPAVHLDPVALRSCLTELLRLYQRYSGVMKAWAEGTSMGADVMAPCGTVIEAIGAAVRAMFGPKRPYALDRRAGGLLLSAAIEHFPNEVRGMRDEPDMTQVVEAQALLVERVLLPRS